jgi:hypothetical protein
METAPLLWYDNKKEKFELYGGKRMKKLLEVTLLPQEKLSHVVV